MNLLREGIFSLCWFDSKDVVALRTSSAVVTVEKVLQSGFAGVLDNLRTSALLG
jgi:hypothetical protein